MRLPFQPEFLHPGFLLLLLVIVLFVAAWKVWPPPLLGGMAKLALGLRVLMVVLIIFSLSGLRLASTPNHRALVAVVDLSDSTLNDRPLEEEMTKKLIAAKPGNEKIGLVVFGRDAQVEFPVTTSPSFTTFRAHPDPTASNLSAGLNLAAGLLPSDTSRQIIIFSDGRENTGDAMETVKRLKEQGILVDVFPVGDKKPDESLIQSLDVASLIRPNQSFTASIRLGSNVASAGDVTLFVDSAKIDSKQVKMLPGSSSISFTVPPLGAGTHQVRAELNASPDTYSQNDVAQAIVRVLGNPRILILEGASGSSENIANALKVVGMDVTVRSSSSAPSNPSELASWDAVVVINASADSFPSNALSAIDSSVADRGMGLVAIGGGNSFGPGGWEGTPLENALPVRMQIPQRPEKPKRAVALVLETMENPQADKVSVAAAEAVIDKLTPQDQLTITTGSGNSNTILIPLTQVTDKASIYRKLETADFGDPAAYMYDIKIAGDALLHSDAQIKHIVLLGDGDPGEDPLGLQNLLTTYNKSNITTSVIGINVHGEVGNMQTLAGYAKAGGGRFYQSDDATQIPQLLLQESQTSLRPWFDQTPFKPSASGEGSVLKGFDWQSLPALGGYVVSTIKPEAEAELLTPKNDPLLAEWTHGLGRAVTWTSDVQGRWTNQFLADPRSASFFVRMVDYALPGEPANTLSLQAYANNDGIDVIVTGPISSGKLNLHVLRQDSSSLDIELPPTSPGKWEGHLPTGVVGSYILHATLDNLQTDASVDIPYSPEYRLIGRDDNFLLHLSSKQTLIGDIKGIWTEPLPSFLITSSLLAPLLLLLVLLWPLEVILRRLPLSLAGWIKIWQEIWKGQPSSVVETALPPELSALKDRLQPKRKALPVIPKSTSANKKPGAISATIKAPQISQNLSAQLLDVRKKKKGASENVKENEK